MRNFFYNTGYFLREVKTIIHMNLMSNIFSFLSTGLIFFILAMVISGWWISGWLVETIQGEAEVSAYFDEGLGNDEIMKLTERIRTIPGVREARLVDKAESYSRMEKILGKEADVLKYLGDNPFSPFIEVKIQMEKIDPILEALEPITGIEHVRDNREVLERLRSITGVLEIAGYLVVTAVGISTMVIISHIIRMGIYDNREQINTLRLLGAPETFIGFPFILEGLLITVGGGVLAAAASVLSLEQIYARISGPLPFIPLPPIGEMRTSLVVLVMCMSVVLGIAGGFFGLSSSRTR